jgi:hypothetical protein
MVGWVVCTENPHLVLECIVLRYQLVMLQRTGTHGVHASTAVL